MWMPISMWPSGSSRTENASSISVVVWSSIENAPTRACGNAGGVGSSPQSANATPRGNVSARKRLKW